MLFGESDIIQIVDAVWTSTLGMSVERNGEHPFPAKSSLTGVVQITGAWQGAITLRCTSDLANAIGGAMFGVEPGSSSAEEVRDALGEVVNMIAGNVKGLLPAGCLLSMPSVVEGTEYKVVVPGTNALLALPLQSAGEPLQIEVFERSE